MRFLFDTAHRDAVSTAINLANFRRLEAIDGVSFTAFQDDYENHDVILFMGYDPEIARARAANPAAKIGIVDIRPGGFDAARGADFLVSNGPEMSAFAARHFSNIVEYPIYTSTSRASAGQRPSSVSPVPLVITYHGNKAHAVAMFPTVTRALEELALTFPIELRIIYNVGTLGPIPEAYSARPPVSVKVIDWHPDVYAQEIACSDIGIVPNLTPLHNLADAERLMSPRDRQFGAHPSEYITRFKATSNAGRLLTFAQFGIPVVADLFPSAAAIIRNGETGYLAHDAFGWYQALHRLCASQALRRKIGQNLHDEFETRYTVPRLNERLVAFCRDLPPTVTPPDALVDAPDLFEDRDRAAAAPSKKWW